MYNIIRIIMYPKVFQHYPSIVKIGEALNNFIMLIKESRHILSILEGVQY